MNKLTKLTIKKFRNVEPTTLEFSPGLNVLLGKNAAGKTTLLRLLSSVVTRSEEAFRDDVFEVSYRSSGQALDFEHTIKKERASEPILPLESEQSMEELSSTQQIESLIFFDRQSQAAVLSAELLPTETVLDLSGKQIREQHPSGMASPFAAVFFALPEGQEALKGPILLAEVRSGGRMDESLEWFNKLLDFKTTKAGGFSRFIKTNLPQEMRDKLRRHRVSTGTSATFSFEFLDHAARVLDFGSASARFDIERLNPERDYQIVRMSNLRFFFTRPNEEISHDLLSYGQKRLLAFFAYADAAQDVIIADELVNGLHHEWIKACLDEIGPRQAFLTSQNPLLLDFLRFDSAEEVRRTFILCERVQQESGARLIWRNPSTEEAESFFSAYQTGIQRVSDILLTKGLW